ncbi:MAG: hypothetical protein JSS02_03050 [Planctomycetes bacterium]|nr:hypothetical protein [Planctomycetota bacterium]
MQQVDAVIPVRRTGITQSHKAAKESGPCPIRDATSGLDWANAGKFLGSYAIFPTVREQSIAKANFNTAGSSLRLCGFA